MDWVTQGNFALAISALVAVLVLARLIAVFGADKTGYCSAGVLLTGAELHFFRSLQQVIPPGCYVACKVRLADILLVSQGANRKSQCRAFNRIKSKHADFVICEVSTFRILGVIELDDRSHRRPDRKARDVFFDSALQSASVPLLRVPVKREYEHRELRDLLTSKFSPRRG
ncbi:DUF2726 domain-containing protein [Verrucomicrobium sp. BvORR106]|uniref:DUF2726 domain-containing protein n=1 Tax=Verrucomicrobium sp. BvORR106 TaxID=1403819 RepID=UPI0006902367|nr:DUF2726 domain-containing protein [Verrucomicrobium sp. BvORR106]